MFENYKYWLKKIAKKSNGKNYSDRTIDKYTRSIHIIKKEYGIDLISYGNINNLFLLKEKLYSNSSFIEKDSRGNKMYSRAVEMFTSYICENTMTIMQDDIDTIEKDDSLTYEEKNSYIETICNIRNPLFQKNFKKELIREFKGQCAICEINDKRILIASHIIPYSECSNKSEMYRSYNGLLLCPIHDSLFDKHLITFDKSGKILIKQDIAKELYAFLNIDDNIRLKKENINKERLECLKKHEDRFSEK